jgi:hypothetical protein
VILLGRGVGASEGHLAVSDDLAQVDNVPVFQQQRGQRQIREQGTHRRAHPQDVQCTDPRGETTTVSHLIALSSLKEVKGLSIPSGFGVHSSLQRATSI